jgi:hypothetical protein
MTNTYELGEQQDYAPEIAEVAYAYWLSRGGEDGHDVEDWLMAEREVLRRHGDRKPADRDREKQDRRASAA